MRFLQHFFGCLSCCYWSIRCGLDAIVVSGCMKFNKLRILIKNANIDARVPLGQQVTTPICDSKISPPSCFKYFGLYEIALCPSHSIVKLCLSTAGQKLCLILAGDAHRLGDLFTSFPDRMLKPIRGKLEKRLKERLKVGN